MKPLLKLVFTLLLFPAFQLSAQWTYFEQMPYAKVQFDMLKQGDSLYMVGGNLSGSMSDKIEIYNLNESKWKSSWDLSSGRCFAGSVIGDSGMYVIGGTTFQGGPWYGSNAIDIFQNGQRTTVQLADTIFTCVPVKVGDYILIAAGIKWFDAAQSHAELVERFHLYNERTKTWSTYGTVNRDAAGVVSTGNQAFIAGGRTASGEVSNRIDIFNAATNTWTTDSLSQARYGPKGFYHKGKIYFAGGTTTGTTQSDVVDIWDGTSWSTAKLSRARGGIRICSTEDYIFFAGGGDLDIDLWRYTSSFNTVDVLNTKTGEWTVSQMAWDRINHAAASSASAAYVAGGISFDNGTAMVSEIEQWNIALHTGSNVERIQTMVFPNPTRDMVTLRIDPTQTVESITLTNSLGEHVATMDASQDVVSTTALAPGVYQFLIQYETGVECVRFVRL